MVHPGPLLLAFLGCIIFQAIAVPTNTNTTLNERTVPAWSFSYGATAAQHQTSFTQLSATGYRPISLSVYGQPPNHLYAAVWVQRSGPAYAAIHDATGVQYQAWFDARAKEGYVSRIVTVTGPESGARFAGIMEKNGVGSWYQKCGLTYDQYNSALLDALGGGYVLKSFAEYGISTPTAGDQFKGRRYCGIWYYSPLTQFYSIYTDSSPASYQVAYTWETTTAGRTGWHPSYFAISEDHLISVQFTNTNIGTWVSGVGMSPSVLQAEYVSQRAQGRYIIHLQGGGTGGSATYAAIWAEGDGLN